MKIKELTLYSADLSATKSFYTEVLGFALIEYSDQELILEIGESRLRFEEDEKATPYHFAFNIPAYSENSALDWLQERVNILLDEGQKIQVFENWQARAIYFYDPDQNIVEFIARRTLNNREEKKFSINSILSISEIGMPVTNVYETCQQLFYNSKLERYDGDLERFAALGDDEGLFICINKSLKNWFPTNDPAFSSNFNIIFDVEKQTYSASFIDGTFKTHN